jgi:hypothetical protein
MSVEVVHFPLLSVSCLKGTKQYSYIHKHTRKNRQPYTKTQKKNLLFLSIGQVTAYLKIRSAGSESVEYHDSKFMDIMIVSALV